MLDKLLILVGLHCLQPGKSPCIGSRVRPRQLPDSYQRVSGQVLPALASLKQSCNSLSTSDAHANDGVAATGACQLMDRLDDENGAGRADGVPKGDAAAVGVDPGGVDIQVLDNRQCLSGEGLVELPEVDLLAGDAGRCQQLLDGRYGPDAHVARVDADHGAGHQSRLI